MEIAIRGMSALIYFLLFRRFRAWSNKDYVGRDVKVSALCIGACPSRVFLLSQILGSKVTFTF